MKGSEKKKMAGNQAINGQKKKDRYVSVMLWSKSATELKVPRGFVGFVNLF